MSKIKRKFGKRLKYNYKRTFLGLFLFVFVLLFGIGYAYLTTNLSIDGTSHVKSSKWDVHFENVVVKEGSVEATTEPTISNDTTINFAATLSSSGEYYDFTVDLVNEGTLDAVIDDLNIVSNAEGESSEYFAYNVTYEDGSEIKVGDYLLSGDSKKIKVECHYVGDGGPDTDLEFSPKVEIRLIQRDSAYNMNFDFNVSGTLADQTAVFNAIMSFEDNVYGTYTIGSTTQEINGTDISLSFKHGDNITFNFDKSVYYNLIVQDYGGYTYTLNINDKKVINSSSINYRGRIGNDKDISLIATLNEVSPSCFISGTKVLTKNGFKNIENVSSGDLVLTKNKLNEYKKVERTIVSLTNELYEIKTKNNNISVTGSHYFYKVGFGYIEASKLRVGDKLYLSNGNSEEIISIKHKYLNNPVKVYNLQIKDNHNYYVGSGILVHNMYISDRNGNVAIPVESKVVKLQSGGDECTSVEIPYRQNFTYTGTPPTTIFNYSLTPTNGNTIVPIGASDGTYAFKINGKRSGTIDMCIPFNNSGSYEYIIKSTDTPRTGYIYDNITNNITINVNDSLEATSIFINFVGSKYDILEFNVSYEGQSGPAD